MCRQRERDIRQRRVATIAAERILKHLTDTYKAPFVAEDLTCNNRVHRKTVQVFNHLSYELELGWKQWEQTGYPDIRDKDCRMLSAVPDVRIHTTNNNMGHVFVSILCICAIYSAMSQFLAFDQTSFTKPKRMKKSKSPEDLPSMSSHQFQVSFIDHTAGRIHFKYRWTWNKLHTEEKNCLFLS